MITVKGDDQHTTLFCASTGHLYRPGLFLGHREAVRVAYNCARPTRVFQDRALREVCDAKNNDRPMCTRRRDGEPAVFQEAM
jgi:hypothetical protein